MTLETGSFSLIQEPETVNSTANILYAADNGVHGFLATTLLCYAAAEGINYIAPQLQQGDTLYGAKLMFESFSAAALVSAVMLETHAIRLRNRVTNIINQIAN